ncbi:MAG: DUF2723 domain-containing protein [Dehalococcoidia bacterium]
MTVVPRPSARTAERRAAWPIAGAVAGAVVVSLVLYLVTMPPTITWWFGGSDSGELISAAEAFGIAHPTGYPLFVLLGFLATRIPAGDIAERVNAMNAVIGALGAGGIVLTVVTLTDGRDARLVFRLAVAVAAALAVATSGLYWSQAIIGEVYILQAALSALVLLVWARPRVHPLLRGAAHGLALTNHLTAIIFLAAALATVARPWRPLRRTAALWFAAGVLAPLGLYLVLPIRAAQDPVAAWSDLGSVGEFLSHVTGQQYQGNFNPFDLPRALADLASIIRLMIEDLPPWMLPAAGIGLYQLFQGRRPFAWFTSLAAAGTLLFAAMYRIVDRAPYLLPAYVVIGVWTGIGLHAALRWAIAWAGAGRRRWAVVAGASAAVLLLAVWSVRAFDRVDLSGDDSALVFARTILEALPPDATYYSARDDVTFALWYAQRTLGLRRDVQVIDVRNPELRGLR